MQRIKEQGIFHKKNVRTWALCLGCSIIGLISCVTVWAAETPKEELLKLYKGKGATASQYTTVEVKKGTFYNEISAKATIAYPLSEAVAVDIDYGTIIFDSFLVAQSQEVKAGDVIAYVHVEQDTVALEEKKIALQRLQERLAQGAEDWEETKADLEEALKTIYNGKKIEIAKIQIQQKETQWEETKADKIKECEMLQEEIATIEAAYAVSEIVAPMDGLVVNITQLHQGDIIKDGSEIAEIASIDEILLAVPNETKLLRYGQILTITNSSETESQEFQGTVVSASAMNVTGDLKGEVAYVKVEDDMVENFINNHFVVSGYTKEIENVLLIPEKAVTISNGIGYVKVLNPDGTITKTGFVIGGNNTSYVWAIDGLEEGMKVIVQ